MLSFSFWYKISILERTRWQRKMLMLARTSTHMVERREWIDDSLESVKRCESAAVCVTCKTGWGDEEKRKKASRLCLCCSNSARCRRRCLQKDSLSRDIEMTQGGKEWTMKSIPCRHIMTFPPARTHSRCRVELCYQHTMIFSSYFGNLFLFLLHFLCRLELFSEMETGK